MTHAPCLAGRMFCVSCRQPRAWRGVSATRGARSRCWLARVATCQAPSQGVPRTRSCQRNSSDRRCGELPLRKTRTSTVSTPGKWSMAASTSSYAAIACSRSSSAYSFRRPVLRHGARRQHGRHGEVLRGDNSLQAVGELPYTATRWSSSTRRNAATCVVMTAMRLRSSTSRGGKPVLVRSGATRSAAAAPLRRSLPPARGSCPRSRRSGSA